MSYKPDGYTDVSAYMLVHDAEVMLTFLEQAFGATRTRTILHDNGDVRHAEARIGDSIVMLGQAEGGAPMHVHVYVPDVDATYEKALAAGGTSVQAPMQQDDPDKRAGVTGPDQVTWWFATQQS